jgi:hypothetical protein
MRLLSYITLSVPDLKSDRIQGFSRRASFLISHFTLLISGRVLQRPVCATPGAFDAQTAKGFARDVRAGQ